MHPKTKITMPMDPDSPLNRAHQCERKAERMLNKGDHNAALQYYKNASEYILQAMEKTKDPVALHSLNVQKENYDKMPNLVKKRKQLDEQRFNVENLQLEVPKPAENGGMVKANGKEEEGKDAIDGAEEIGNEICLMSMEPVTSRNPGVGPACDKDEKERLDSFESLPSVASEDTDSLLQCLNEHCEQDKKEMRTLYRPTLVLQALRAFGSSRASMPVPEARAPEQNKKGKRREVDEKVLLEELAIQNVELRKHVVSLLEQMEYCQHENDHLKTRLEALQQELETLKMRKGIGSQRPTEFGNEFSVPFSLLGLSDSRALESDSRSNLLVSQTPPALAPLEMPNFDDQ